MHLSKHHRQSFRPSFEKLFNLIRKARPENTSSARLKHLEDIKKGFNPIKRIQNALVRFRVSFLAENVCFNDRIMLEIIYINGKPVLHIIDEAHDLAHPASRPDMVIDGRMLGGNIY